MMKYFSIVFILLFTFSCKKNTEAISAQSIVDKSIATSGGKKFSNSIISFDFRGRHYKALRNNGVFTLSRSFRDSLGVYRDELSNKGFNRFINNERVKVSDTMAPRYARSVNSVHYFSVLPYGLNDNAVNKFYLGETTIKEKNYHKIKVTFNKEGGGDDFEDVFIYWINAKSFKVEYLAYSYIENNGEYGLRFREAYNERYVNDFRFVDYNNYKPNNDSIKLTELDKLFEAEKLKLVSKIELKSIKVK